MQMNAAPRRIPLGFIYLLVLARRERENVS